MLNTNIGSAQVFILLEPISIYKALAIEQVLFSSYTSSEDYILVFWRSKGAVVIGRNQDPWKECNMAFLQNEKLDLARRDTGGGAVYHDEGNLNISVISSYIKTTPLLIDAQMPIKHDGVYEHLFLLKETLRKLYGIEAHITKENDVHVNDKKVTGSAMRIVKQKILHHFTLLLNANIPALRSALNSTVSIDSKAVSSRRYSVENLFYDHSEITRAYIENFKEYFMSEISLTEYKNWRDVFCSQKQKIQFESFYKRLISNEWIFGRTPQSIIHLSVDGIDWRIPILHGTIQRIIQKENPSIYMEFDVPIPIDEKSMRSAFNNVRSSFKDNTAKKVLHELYKTIYVWDY